MSVNLNEVRRRAVEAQPRGMRPEDRIKWQQRQALSLLAEQGHGRTASPIQLQQQMALRQAMHAQAAMAPRGMNPALGRVLALQQAARAGSGAVGQLGMNRAQEIQQARAVFLQAALRAKQGEFQSNLAKSQVNQQEMAAQLARTGAMISGISNAAATGVAAYSSGQQPEQQQQKPQAQMQAQQMLPQTLQALQQQQNQAYVRDQFNFLYDPMYNPIYTEPASNPQQW